MRAGVVVLLAACAHSAPPPAAAKTWPAAGRCIAPRDPGNACIHVSPDDAKAIQAVLASVPGAHDLAMKPITDGAVGYFLLYGWTQNGFTGDVLRAEAVENQHDENGGGYRVILGRDGAGWHVLNATTFDGGDEED